MCSQWRRQQGSRRGGREGEANHKPISIPALGSSLPAPLVPSSHSNLSPENHFELDLLRASLKAALMCALKSRRSRCRSRSRTNTKTSLWSENDGRVAQREVANWYWHRWRRGRCLSSAQSVGQFAAPALTASGAYYVRMRIMI